MYRNSDNEKTPYDGRRLALTEATRRQIRALNLAAAVLNVVGANWGLRLSDIPLLLGETLTTGEALAVAHEIEDVQHFRRLHYGTDQLDHLIVTPSDGERLLDEEIALLRGLATLIEMGLL